MNNLARLTIFSILNSNPKIYDIGTELKMTPKALQKLINSCQPDGYVFLNPRDYTETLKHPPNSDRVPYTSRATLEQGLMCKVGNIQVLQSSGVPYREAYAVSPEGRVSRMEILNAPAPKV
jgi:hypothetical protein